MHYRSIQPLVWGFLLANKKSQLLLLSVPHTQSQPQTGWMQTFKYWGHLQLWADVPCISLDIVQIVLWSSYPSVYQSNVGSLWDVLLVGMRCFRFLHLTSKYPTLLNKMAHLKNTYIGCNWNPERNRTLLPLQEKGAGLFPWTVLYLDPDQLISCLYRDVIPPPHFLLEEMDIFSFPVW